MRRPLTVVQEGFEDLRRDRARRPGRPQRGGGAEARSSPRRTRSDRPTRLRIDWYWSVDPGRCTARVQSWDPRCSKASATCISAIRRPISAADPGTRRSPRAPRRALGVRQIEQRARRPSAADPRSRSASARRSGPAPRAHGPGRPSLGTNAGARQRARLGRRAAGTRWHPPRRGPRPGRALDDTRDLQLRIHPASSRR